MLNPAKGYGSPLSPASSSISSTRPMMPFSSSITSTRPSSWPACSGTTRISSRTPATSRRGARSAKRQADFGHGRGRFEPKGTGGDRFAATGAGNQPAFGHVNVRSRANASEARPARFGRSWGAIPRPASARRTSRRKPPRPCRAGSTCWTPADDASPRRCRDRRSGCPGCPRPGATATIRWSDRRAGAGQW